MDFNFEKLDVYQRALEFARQILTITSEFGRKLGWSDQISRAAMSVSLNIAEGSGRVHIKEKRNFYTIARGSIYECVPLIDLGVSLKIFTDKQRFELRENCIVIAKMLTKLIQSVTEKDDN